MFPTFGNPTVTWIHTTLDGVPVYTSTPAGVFTSGHDFSGIYMKPVFVAHTGEYAALLASVTGDAFSAATSTSTEASFIGSSASSAASSTGEATASGGGLSTGAKAAIGTAIPLGVIATAASIGFFVYWKRTQRALESQAMADPGMCKIGVLLEEVYIST
jgi:hypothetical protein